MKKLPFVLVLLVFLLSACGGSGNAVDTSCIDVDLFQCDGFDPQATITNNCDQTIWMAKVVFSAYDANNNKIDADEEYVENLAPGREQTLEAVFQKNWGSTVKRCGAKVESATFE